jgi:hypothetical protein
MCHFFNAHAGGGPGGRGGKAATEDFLFLPTIFAFSNPVSSVSNRVGNWATPPSATQNESSPTEVTSADSSLLQIRM